MNSKLRGVLLICLGFSFFGCGLFHKGVPKKGEFCYVLAKPPACLFVDFELKKLYYENGEYELSERTRMEYTFLFQGVTSELLITTENRVDIKIHGESVSKFYMRKKEKFSKFPPSNP